MAHRTVRLTSAGGRPNTAVVRAVTDGVAAGRLELRQLRYFVTLAEELHFGRAAAREHIAPSALTAQLQRLERALGVLLVDRSPRRIALTAAGRAVPDRGPADPGARGPGGDGRPGRRADARRRCGSACSTRGTTRSARSCAPSRTGTRSWRSTRSAPVCRSSASCSPTAGWTSGVGRVSGASTAIASELFRLDPLGVLVRADHPFAAADRACRWPR